MSIGRGASRIGEDVGSQERRYTLGTGVGFPPMRRRSYLGLVVTLVAGCSGDGGTPTSESTPTSTSSQTSTATPAITVSEFSVPSVVEIGDPFSATVAVANGGESDTTFESTMSARYGGGEWTELEQSVSLDAAAGETVTTTVDMPTEAYVRPATYRLDATGTEARATIVGRELAWGDSHALPNEIELTIAEPTFPETYTFETSGGTREEPPPEGERWAIVSVTAENTGNATANAPGMPALQLHEGDNEFRGEPLANENLDQYRGGDVGAGETITGDIPASIPADLALADLHLEYAGTYDGGAVDLVWTVDPG